MKSVDRKQVLLGVLGLLAVAAVVTWMMLKPGERPEPNAPGYYTGPMRMKGGDSYGDDNGKAVAPPAGKSELVAKSAGKSSKNE